MYGAIRRFIRDVSMLRHLASLDYDKVGGFDGICIDSQLLFQVALIGVRTNIRLIQDQNRHSQLWKLKHSKNVFNLRNRIIFMFMLIIFIASKQFWKIKPVPKNQTSSRKSNHVSGLCINQYARRYHNRTVPRH